MGGNSKAMVAAAAVLLTMSVSASAGTFSVPGTANPFLSGAPSGSTCCSGDSTPGDSPIYAGSVTPGETLTFTDVTGSVSYAGGGPTDPPDGDSGDPIDTSVYEGGADYINSIAGYNNMPVDALVGVFLPTGGPLGADEPGTLLDFSSSGKGTDFTSLSPAVQQIFFIGDGLTGTGSGSVQTFVVPTNASELYLGVADGYGWYNNTGTINVTVNAASAVPENSTWAMMMLGFLSVGLVAYRRSSPRGSITRVGT